MGFVKRQMERDLERGFSSFGLLYVCDACLADDFVKRFVREHVEQNECGYCGRKAGQPIAAPVDDVADVIVEGLKYEYDDPANELFYDGREGGYQGTVQDIADLLLSIDDPIEGDAFREGFIEQLIETQWTKRDYGIPFQNEALIYDWEEFVERVKFDSRFFFLLHQPDPAEVEFGQSPTVLAFLERLGRLAEEAGAFSFLEAGAEFWRGRASKPDQAYVTAEDLGTAPGDKALQSNRMSPAGIPAFYGADSLETARAELGASKSSEKPCWSAGLFAITESALVLDLAALPTPPSLYDPDRRHLRRPLFFLEHFAAEVSKALEDNKREHIDYVPTEVVAEFFRVAFVPEPAKQVDGILYSSAQMAGGVCSALFVPNERCQEKGEDSPELSLVLLNSEDGC